jgi:alpha-tubulin suppressor-like RCC1 family protein
MESFGEPAVPVKRDAAGRKQRPKDLVEDALRPRYCTTLHEVPALRGVEIAQIAAGSEHSVARTPSGLVLGWGRQTHGQTGLSNALGMECVPIPSEIVLSKCFPNTSVDIRCTDVKAAADNTFFTMSRREPGTVAGGKIDVLAVGKGQWGTLGNAMWSQVTSVPVKVKTVSGLIECESSRLLLREHS